MDVLTADELSSVLDHLSLKSICRIAVVCRQLHAVSKAKVVEMSALESFCTIERAQEGPMRNALRRPCFVEFCGPLLAVTNRWDIGRVHLINVETSSVETSCGSFGGPHGAEETDQELNEPRGVCFDSGSGSGSGTLYVVDAQNARLRPLVTFNPLGRGFSAGWDLSRGPSEFARDSSLVPQDVAVLPDGRLCVTRAFDKQKKRPAIDQCMIIQPAPASSEGGSVDTPLARLRFGPYGTTGGWGQLSQPRCCCGFGSEVFVADAALHRIAVYDSTRGEAVRMLGGQGAAPGLFRAPFGVAVAEGCLVVSESVGARVQVLTLHSLPLPQPQPLPRTRTRTRTRTRNPNPTGPYPRPEPGAHPARRPAASPGRAGRPARPLVEWPVGPLRCGRLRRPARGPAPRQRREAAAPLAQARLRRWYAGSRWTLGGLNHCHVATAAEQCPTVNVAPE